MGRGVSGPRAGLGLNERAWQIADAMAANAEALRIAVRKLPGGARVIDAGVDAPGGLGSPTSRTRRFRSEATRGPVCVSGLITRR